MKSIISIIIITCTFNVLSAQNEANDITRLITTKDSLFWVSYNSCDTEFMKQFISDDVEFYHDKGGVTNGGENLVNTIKKNLCSNDAYRLRREAVKGTVKVFPLRDNNVVYGAIISGEHVFYILENGKPEFLDGLAKFSQLWILKNNEWKMTRILSYDHGPAVKPVTRKEIKLPVNTLKRYVGKYLTPQSGECDVQTGDNILNLNIGDQKYVLFPFSENSFFVKDRDLTFEFSKNDKGVLKMIVRENGNIVEEAVRQKN
ncbi:MAG: nuclear transport factor 2 family protein [Bacteroidota bacterium]